MGYVTAPLQPPAEHVLAGDFSSLMHGWVPISVQVISAIVLALAVGWRSKRWRMLGWPVAGAVGGATAYAAHHFVDNIVGGGITDEPAPPILWMWSALTGVAVTVLLLGWRGARRWRHGAALMSVPLCLLSVALAVNMWVGYTPTMESAWNQLTGGPLPDQTDQASATALASKGTPPTHGGVLQVNIPADASHFRHRGELVYLPPAWFTSNPPPQLPAVMMIGGQFNTPADWVRAGSAVATMDAFAGVAHGAAPVLVFVDSGGSFNNDTECVNGVRGNAADHLTKDVIPYMISNFGVSPDRANWGVVGWSMGGTCAVDLTVMHPELFSTFVDIGGDYGPNSGTKAQTVARLFGGDDKAWAAFDPTTVIKRHGHYNALSGWFTISSDRPPAQSREFVITDAGSMRLASNDAAANPGNEPASAYSLCALGHANGIDCAVFAQPGKHDWPFAARAFASALPWLAGRLDTPGAPRIGLPGTPRYSALTSPTKPAGKPGTTSR